MDGCPYLLNTINLRLHYDQEANRVLFVRTKGIAQTWQRLSPSFYGHLLNIQSVILLVSLIPESEFNFVYVPAWIDVHRVCADAQESLKSVSDFPELELELCVAWCGCWETNLDYLVHLVLSAWAISPALQTSFWNLNITSMLLWERQEWRMEARSTYTSGGKKKKKKSNNKQGKTKPNHLNLEIDGNGTHQRLSWWELGTPEPCSEMGAVDTWALHHSHLSARLRVMTRPIGWVVVQRSIEAEKSKDKGLRDEGNHWELEHPELSGRDTLGQLSITQVVMMQVNGLAQKEPHSPVIRVNPMTSSASH